MLIRTDEIRYGDISALRTITEAVPVDLTDETMQERKQKILSRMEKEELDALCVYADREHGGNFGYLTGFEPRFEEAVLVLHKKGKAFLLLGNESLKMAQYARIKAKAVHVPHFSLPDQPMETEFSIKELMEQAGLKKGMRAGIAGWKRFTSKKEENEKLFEVPSFIVEAIRETIGDQGSLWNKNDLFLHPETGARIRVNANEAAHFEYGASKASQCVLRVMDEIEEGKTELELAEFLHAQGQPQTVQAICATGERFTNAVVAPRNKKVVKGDRFSVTMGLKGGLTCRAGFAAESDRDLPEEQKGYMEEVVKPYFAALATWYSSVGLGVSAGEIYDLTEQVIPAEMYGWKLNPGHYTSSEEWLSSPFYKGSEIILGSGMMIQMDIIISVPNRAGVNAEDGILLADESLRDQIKKQYPEVWERMQARRDYMRQILGIPISEEVLPMSQTCGYLRPYLLEKKKGVYVEKFIGREQDNGE